MNYEHKLRELLRQGKVVPVIGAGVSLATADLPGWKGLIESGLDYAEDRKAISSLLEKGRELLANNNLTVSADVVKELLNAPGHPFTNWLNEIMGRPKIKSSLLIESIQNLCQPILATTNYDDLLRSVGSPQTDLALDWKQHEEIQSCLDNHKQFVLHLHGIYTRPDTPIFGANDYDKLKNEIGYKTILSQLWMQKHFLFIGCSRDGVMDEDFSTVLKLMNEWFPQIQNEHYILMLDSELGSAPHWELMTQSNVHVIPFGKDYHELADFINRINPNAEEIAKRLLDRTKKAYSGIKAILEAQPNNQIDSLEMDLFIKQNLGLSHYWVDNDRIKVFENALARYNSEVGSKKQAFRNRQMLTQAMVNVADLKNKIDVWYDNSRDTTKLNNLEFINTGIMAYERLNSFPPEMLDDVKLRYHNIIHHGYFSGHLSQFYREAINWKKKSGHHDYFNGDNYFFENLRRIMSSLFELLSLDPEKIYSTKSPAKIAKQLPEECLLQISEKNLTLRNTSRSYDVIAELPWDENLEFIDAQLIVYNSAPLVIGFNAKHCFKWNPLEELTSTNFYSAPSKNSIHDLKIWTQNDSLILEIYKKDSKVVMVDFGEVSTELNLVPRYGQYIRLENGKTFCRYPISIGIKGNCIFEYNLLGEYHPVISTTSLWAQIIDIPYVKDMVDNYLLNKNDNPNKVTDSFIGDIELSAVRWLNTEVLVVRCRIELSGPASFALLFFDLDAGFNKSILTIFFPHKNCFCHDTIVIENHVNLIVGYLDFNEVGNLIQFFDKIDLHQIIIAEHQPGIVPQDKFSRSYVRDMFNATFATSRKAYVVEEGKVLHDIELPSLIDVESVIDGGLKEIRYYEFGKSS